MWRRGYTLYGGIGLKPTTRPEPKRHGVMSAWMLLPVKDLASFGQLGCCTDLDL